MTQPLGRRWELRARLEELERQYGDVQRLASLNAHDPDWSEADRINEEREPLFAELHALERHLPQADQRWEPVRFKEPAG